VYDRRLDRWQPGDHVGTFRGQEFAFRAGRATIETIRDENLLLQATKHGHLLMQALADFAGQPGFGEVRGVGLYIGMECTACFKRNAGEVAKFLQASALSEHILLERSGRESAVLRFLPPLTITEAEIARVVAAVGRGFAQLADS
jgi:diaminobutyrate-2-oxoglutarate transaminase